MGAPTRRPGKGAVLVRRRIVLPDCSAASTPRPHPDCVPPVMPDLSSSLVGTPSAYGLACPRLVGRVVRREPMWRMCPKVNPPPITSPASRPVGRPGSRPRHAELRVGAAAEMLAAEGFPRYCATTISVAACRTGQRFATTSTCTSCQLRELIDTLGIELMHLIGWSMGWIDRDPLRSRASCERGKL